MLSEEPTEAMSSSDRLEKGGPKDHFAIYLLPEGPFSLELWIALFAPK
jgi:hypothetical protein